MWCINLITNLKSFRHFVFTSNLIATHLRLPTPLPTAKRLLFLSPNPIPVWETFLRWQRSTSSFRRSDRRMCSRSTTSTSVRLGRYPRNAQDLKVITNFGDCTAEMKAWKLIYSNFDLFQCFCLKFWTCYKIVAPMIKHFSIFIKNVVKHTTTNQTVTSMIDLINVFWYWY